MDKVAKKSYTTPKLVIYGDVQKITKGNNVGTYLDADFPTGTPYGDLTFTGPPPPP